MMQPSVRAYLAAGLSTLAVGTILVGPTGPLSVSSEVAPPAQQIRSSDVQLAALSTPLRSEPTASRQESVHLLAEISRGLTFAKEASASSSRRANPLFSSAAPARPSVGAGVVTEQDPTSADGPRSTHRQALAGPPSAAAAPINFPGLGGVLATATQLTLDVFVTTPATITQGSVANINQVILAVGTLDPNEIDHALHGFIPGEQITVGTAANTINADLTSLEDAIIRLIDKDAVGEIPTALKVAKTTEPATSAGADAGSVDHASSNEQRGNVDSDGSKGHVVVGKVAHDGSSGSAERHDATGAKDGSVTTGNASDTKASRQSASTSTDGQARDTSAAKSSTDSESGTAAAKDSSKTQPSRTDSGDISGSKQNTVKVKDPSKTNTSGTHSGNVSGSEQTTGNGTTQSKSIASEKHSDGGSVNNHNTGTGGRHRAVGGAHSSGDTHRHSTGTASKTGGRHAKHH